MHPAQKVTSVSETVLAQMRKTNELFSSEVVVKQNIDFLEHVYTKHARILPPGAQMLEGREQIKDFWKHAIAGMGLSGVRLTTLEAESAGDGVIEIGRADLNVRSGQLVTVKYVVHWKQEDGEWKWNVDIWNPNE